MQPQPMYHSDCMVARLEVIASCPTIPGCRPLALRRVVIGRVTYHLCYGISDKEVEPLELEIHSVQDGMIHFSRDGKYILLMYSEAMETYSDGDNSFYGTPDITLIKGELCIAQDLPHTVFSLFKHAVNMQYPAENNLPCGDLEMVSINSTHAIRRAFWLGHAKMCRRDAHPVISVYQPYSWACAKIGRPPKKTHTDDDPGWLERAFRSITQWVANEVDALVDWIVRFIVKIVEYLFAEVLKVLGQVWSDIMKLDNTFYIVETMVLLFLVTYRSNLSAGIILIVIVYITVGLKRVHPFRLMGLFDNSY